MRVIIIGGGQVGTELARRLSKGHDVVVIEKNSNMARKIEGLLDLLVITGNGASVSTLEKAGIREAKFLIAVTEIDEVNIIACMLAKKYGVGTTVARIRNTEYADGSQVLTSEQLGIDIIINPERVAALEIAKMIRSPNVSEVEDYVQGNVRVMGYFVDKDSPFTGKKIMEIDFPQGCIVCAIMRKPGEIIIPGGADEIRLHDEIYLLGKRDAFETFWWNPGRKRYPKNIVIAGGGRVGYQVAEILEKKNKYSIKIIERNKDKCREIADLLNSTLVVQGDVTDISFLQEEEISRADVFVAVTGDDEVNLLSTLLADHLGARVTISEVIRPDYSLILDTIGIDRVVSPRLMTAAQIMKLIRKGDVISLTILREDKAEVVELIVPERAYVAHKRLKDIKLPPGILVGALVRDEDIYVPSGECKIYPGDRVVLFYLSQLSDEVDTFFSSEKKEVRGIEKFFKGLIWGK